MAAEHKRFPVTLPNDLVEQMDTLAGPRNRSAFLAAAVEQELRRRKLAAKKSAEIQAREASERFFLN